MYAVLYGVGDGIIGMVQQPYVHGKISGLGGIIKGLILWRLMKFIYYKGCAIGTTGIIIKPITGVFDAASKTAEGLTNTATAFDDKPNNERIRFARPFYSMTR